MTKESSVERSLVYLVASLIWLLLCSFGIYSGPDQKLIERLYTGAAIATIAISVTYIATKWVRQRDLTLVICSLGVLIFFMLTVAGGSGLASATDRWLSKPQVESFLVAPVSVLVLSFGLTLFYVRLRLRFFYGLTEVLVGIAVAANKVVDELKNASAISASWSLAMLTAGVYLVVRGLDNMHQGLSKEPMDKAALWLQQFIPTTRNFEARTAILRFKESSGVSQALVFRTFHKRRSLSSKFQSARVQTKPDGTQQHVQIAFHFIVLEGDSLVFRLDDNDAADALEMRGTRVWEPSKESGKIPNWIVIPYEMKSQWKDFFRKAVDIGITRPADEEPI